MTLLADRRPRVAPGVLCPKCRKPFRRKGACPTQWCERHERWECGRHLLFIDQWTCEIPNAPEYRLRLSKANEECQ